MGKRGFWEKKHVEAVRDSKIFGCGCKRHVWLPIHR